MSNPSTQLSQISQGLTSLSNILDDDIAQHLLQIATKAEPANKRRELARLQTTIEQYETRNRQLFYIAFMGHFSAGKSSSINTILKPTDGPGPRETGLNPTDKAITLITDPANMNSLVGLYREGKLPVRAVPFAHQLLQHVVIADTPGSGDPGIANELTKDFLAVCDCLFYFVSAANPIDSADLPLLALKQERLPHVPVRFIVTRADEFCVNKYEAVSHENFDWPKANDFLGQLGARLQGLMPACKSTEELRERFIFVDNEDQYNTDGLSRAVLEAADPNNLSTRIAVHDHKIVYFRRAGAELRDYYLRQLRIRSTGVNAFIASARTNVTRYQQSAQIANNTLTERWARSVLRIQKCAREQIDGIPALDLQEDTPKDPWKGRRLQAEQLRLKQTAERQAPIAARTVIRSTLQSIGNYHRTKVQELLERLAETELRSGGYQPVKDQIQPEPTYVKHDRTTIATDDAVVLRSDLAKSRTQLRNYLYSIRLAVSNYLEGIQTALSSEQLRSELDDITEEAQREISADIESLFQKVEIYRSGVFAMQSKRQIELLGLGRELDRLEVELSDRQRQGIHDRAIEQLLSGRRGQVEVYDRACTALLDEAAAVARRIDAQSIAIKALVLPEDHLSQETQVAVDQIATIVADNVRRRLIGEWQALSESQQGTWEAANREFERERSRVLGDWKKQGWSWALAVGVVFGLALGAMQYSTLQLGTTLWAALAVNVFADLVVGGTARAIYQRTTRPTVSIANLYAKYVAEYRGKAMRIVEASFVGLKEEDVHLDDATALLLEAWTRSLSMHSRSTATACRGVTSELSTIADDLIRLHEATTESITRLSAGHRAFFDDSTGNIRKLEVLAQELREQAIEPSFTFITTTGNRLQDIERRLTQVKM